MLRQKDGAGVGNALQAFFGHGKYANLVDGTKAVLDGPDQPKTAVRIAFKVQDGVNHVLQNTRARQGAFFGDVAHQDNGGAGGFRGARQVGGTLANLRHRSWGRGELVGVHRLNGVNDCNVGSLGLQGGQYFFQLNFSQNLNLAVV